MNGREAKGRQRVPMDLEGAKEMYGIGLNGSAQTTLKKKKQEQWFPKSGGTCLGLN